MGGMASITGPGVTASLAQVENRPSPTFLMPTRNSGSCVAVQIEVGAAHLLAVDRGA